MTAATARPRPCPTCPLRLDCPSGVWAAGEYDMLADYDGEIADQAQTANGVNAFHCHTTPDLLCSGWVGFRPPVELLAVRIGISLGRIDPAVLDYQSPVPLFGSGAAAAEHGKRDIYAPGPAAKAAVRKVIRVRERSGDPVRLVAPDEEDAP